MALAGLGVVFSTVKLIACEFNASAFSTYFGRKIYTPTCLLYILLLGVLSLIAVCVVYLLQTFVCAICAFNWY